MESDAQKQRLHKPYVFTDLKSGYGCERSLNMFLSWVGFKQCKRIPKINTEVTHCSGTVA